MARKAEREEYVNADGLVVTEYINTGRTKVFACKDEAEKHALHRKSYRYSLYLGDTYVGQAVPQ